MQWEPCLICHCQNTTQLSDLRIAPVSPSRTAILKVDRQLLQSMRRMLKCAGPEGVEKCRNLRAAYVPRSKALCLTRTVSWSTAACRRQDKAAECTTKTSACSSAVLPETEHAKVNSK